MPANFDICILDLNFKFTVYLASSNKEIEEERRSKRIKKKENKKIIKFDLSVF
jgi:hypothetical protein